MELSERIIQNLESEGFTSICEESLSGGISQPEHTSPHQVAIAVTDGSLKLSYKDITVTLLPGDRHDISANVSYSITGSTGSNYIVGEK